MSHPMHHKMAETAFRRQKLAENSMIQSRLLSCSSDPSKIARSLRIVFHEFAPMRKLISYSKNVCDVTHLAKQQQQKTRLTCKRVNQVRLLITKSRFASSGVLTASSQPASHQCTLTCGFATEPRWNLT